MSYRISYTTSGYCKKKYRTISISSKFTLFLSMAVIILISFFALSEDHTHSMYMLFPWVEPITKTAISNFKYSVQQGMSLTDAISAFCEEIIQGAPF